MIFADTVYLLALLSPDDQWHAEANKISRTRREPILTTAWVLVETGNGLAGSANRSTFVAFVHALQTAKDVKIIPATMQWFERGLDLYGARPDKEWSLTDCISFLAMREHDLTQALTADHHFEQAGFEILLKRSSA